MKICTKCNIEKPLTEFCKDKKTKDGLRSQCKSCEREYKKEYRKQNKERIKESDRKYREKNKERLKEKAKNYREQNKELIKERGKKYRERNKERIKERRERNKERKRESDRKYREKNKEYFKEYREKYKERRNELRRERLKTDPLFKMKKNLRNRTWSAFKNKGYSKKSKTQEMLGVDWGVCKAHIERQFTKGMNWDNYGDWHIDHKIPLASANTEEELKKLCHYSNLQPLWAEDNLSKNDKINGQQIKFRI